VWSGLVLLAAAGELVGDKLPFTPSRLGAPSLGARLVSGGLCGGVLAKRGDGSRALGIACGALGAVGSAWLGYTVRHALTERGLPDFAVALCEDGVAIYGASRVVDF
jgi:uncharacterized membrane protein